MISLRAFIVLGGYFNSPVIVVFAPVYLDKPPTTYRINSCGPKMTQKPELKPGMQLEEETSYRETQEEWRYSNDLPDFFYALFSLGFTRKAELWRRSRMVYVLKVYDYKGNLLSVTETPGEWGEWVFTGLYNLHAKGYGHPGEDSIWTTAPGVGPKISIPLDKPEQQDEHADESGDQQQPESQEPEVVAQPVEPEVDPDVTNMGKGEEDSYEFRFFGFIRDVGGDQDVTGEEAPYWLTQKVGKYQKFAEATKGVVLSPKQVKSMSQYNNYVPNVNILTGPDKSRQLVGWKIVAANWRVRDGDYWRGLGSTTLKDLVSSGQELTFKVTYGVYITYMEPVYSEE